MTVKSHIHVRQMEIGDFEFVRGQAARQQNFTVPAPYVLWLLLRIKDAVCLVAENKADGLLAYLLAVPIEVPSKSLYVWQLAASPRGERLNASVDMMREFGEIVRRLRVKSISFSAVPGSAAFRAIRRRIWKIAAAKPKMAGALPPVVSEIESEYRIDLISNPRGQ